MKKFFKELKKRNSLLYWFGWFNIIVAIGCIAQMPIENFQVLGVNRWLKPMKFYISVGIMVWTMAWIMHHLSNERIKKAFSWLIIFTMTFENGLILLQAIRKSTSHFNTATIFDESVFQLMGVFIFTFTLTCILMTIAFFIQRSFQIPEVYLWSIRLGLIFFIVFSIEGGLMVALMKHTVGANDGSEGLPLLNWSIKNGDLRVAHFFGLHALQVIPLAGWYITKKKKQLFIFAFVYFMFVLLLVMQALSGVSILF